jgi:hypothetical protein
VSAPAGVTIRDRVKELRRVRAGDLLKNPKNWRTHDSAQRAALEGVLREVGLAGATLARETEHGLILLDGHLRADLDPDLMLPVLVLDVTEAEGDVLLASFDPISAMAGQNAEAFAALVQDLTVGDTALRAMLLRMAQDLPAGLRPPSLAQRFLAPPFTVLDARQGYWQERKRAWLALGLEPPLPIIGGVRQTGKNSAMNRLSGRLARDHDEDTPMTSIFDPVLCELAVRWFCPPKGRVLDPFAGGAVRGVVAGLLGRSYHGIDLRPEQVEANKRQWAALESAVPGDWQEALGPRGGAAWEAGDARERVPLAGACDLVFSCPPYGALEVYSDDARDLSSMEPPAFVEAYRAVIAASVGQLSDDRFAVWVVADFRDEAGRLEGFVADTVKAFEAAGAPLYNEAVLLHPAGSLPLRAARAFVSGRKLARQHEAVLVFCKGDPRRAAEACGPVETAEHTEWGERTGGDA